MNFLTRLFQRNASVPQSTGVNCPLCHRLCAAPTVLGTVTATHSGPFSVAEYNLVECSDCEVVRLDPIPSAADLHALYQASVQFSDAHYTDPEQIERMLAYYGSCLDNRGLMPAAGETMLEVGAGFAWVARACRLRSSAVHTWAQDVTAECEKRCPWVDRYMVGMLDVVPRAQQFKLISLTHVIEHLADPGAILADLATRLTPDGKIFVTAPYRPKGWQSGDGIKPWLDYSYLHVPAHISYLSKRWFTRSAEQNGLRLLSFDPAHDNGQAFEAILGR